MQPNDLQIMKIFSRVNEQLVAYSHMSSKLVKVARVIKRYLLDRTTPSGGLPLKMCGIESSRITGSK